ncbi:MAG TPA: hypothetical protein VMR23_17935 [Candidatus Limnocylindria bacterium]|nr:hypothetical protein [Candidatus Limnocylindria bacterium]
MKRTGLMFVLTSNARGGVEEVVLALLRRFDPGEFRLSLRRPAGCSTPSRRISRR